MKKNKAIIADKIFTKVLGGEKWYGITIPLFSIVLALFTGALILLALGKNPIDVYQSLVQGSGLLPKQKYAGGKSIITDFTSMLDVLTPMIFAALAVVVAFKAGLFNIGVSGQMLFAGFVATITVGYSSLPMYIALPLVIIIGSLGGALIAGFIGVLKYKFNINEVVSSIMLNYILQYVISFFIYTYFLDPVSRQSGKISDTARLTITDYSVGNIKVDLPLGFILAIITVIIVHFLFKKTKLGYEIKAVGLSTRAAKYAGISLGKTMVTSMILSGVLSGLAGVTYYMGYLASIQPKALTSVGYDAIAVSLLGNSNPFAIVFSSLLITGITKGSAHMTSTEGLSVEIASVITGLLLLFSACGVYIRHLAHKSNDRISKEIALQSKEGGKK